MTAQPAMQRSHTCLLVDGTNYSINNHPLANSLINPLCSGVRETSIPVFSYYKTLGTDNPAVEMRVGGYGQPQDI